MSNCFICNGKFEPYIDNIEDFEYGVKWPSKLVKCAGCGLITHEPRVKADQIGELYPTNYFAHKKSSKGLFAKIKAAIARYTVKDFGKYLSSGAKLLEIGCGNRSFLFHLNSVRPDVKLAGVDIVAVDDPYDVEIEFYQGQLEEVEMPKEGFDFIYSSNLIEHVADPKVFLDKCVELLKPGGLIYFITPDHLSVDQSIFGRYWAGYHYPRHTYLFNHNNARPFLQNAGLEVEKIKGSYAFWYTSIMNRYSTLPGLQKRGIGFILISAMFFPLDILINFFRPHGSMTFIARKPSSS